jgi:AcrR family transcriptional regulator
MRVIGERQQRTQAERSAATQAALLDATIDSLVESGYARTSTTEITRRAGVSRGAQVHHYPTKTDLVVAAVQRLFRRQQREYAARFAALSPDERTLERAIDELWSIIGSPTYAATLELVVAARTDPELQVVVHAVAAQFRQTVQEIFAAFFPDIARAPHGERLVGFAFAVLQGAAVSGYAGFQRPEDVVAVMRSLVPLATPQGLSRPGGSDHDHVT